MLKRAREREREGMNKRRSLMTAADSPIQKETTEGFLATVEAVLIALPYCTELLSKMLCLPLFIQAKVCVCVFGDHQDSVCGVCVIVRVAGRRESVCVCVLGVMTECVRVHSHASVQTCMLGQRD